MKKALLMVAGSAVQKLMMTLAKEQEILINIANMASDIFVSESIMLRTEKLVAHKGEAECSAQLDMISPYLNDAVDHLNLRRAKKLSTLLQMAMNSVCSSWVLNASLKHNLTTPKKQGATVLKPFD